MKKLLLNQNADIPWTLHQKLIFIQFICPIKRFNLLFSKLKRHYQSVPLSLTEIQVNRKENLSKLSQVKRSLSNKAQKRNDFPHRFYIFLSFEFFLNKRKIKKLSESGKFGYFHFVVSSIFILLLSFCRVFVRIFLFSF